MITINNMNKKQIGKPFSKKYENNMTEKIEHAKKNNENNIMNSDDIDS